MDQVTDHYEMEIRFTFKQANRYGDQLAEGSLTCTKKLKARTLSEIGVILSQIDEIK